VPRRLGQHFLKRADILERIARLACPAPEPLVIEIGAGSGSLTRRLLPRAERLIAIEIDPRLAARLQARFPDEPRLAVLAADVLRLDLTQWGPAVVAGNLPYYISSPILERVLALGPALKRAALLVQQEVAERLAAAPGSRAYGLLSVRAQLATTPEILLRVPPSAFSPPPKVSSALVRLAPRAELPLPWSEQPRFLEFAARCFRHKRKTLRNNLRAPSEQRLLAGSPEASLRAEQLPLDRLIALYRRLHRRE
jgi:16S rRNA (adenine1518-N6/adenine1519-N6)-dimethyltransferase